MMNPFKLLSDAMRGKIDDQYLSNLDGQDLALAMQFRLLPDQIREAVESALKKAENPVKDPPLSPIWDETQERYLYGTDPQSAGAAEDVLSSGNGDG